MSFFLRVFIFRGNWFSLRSCNSPKSSADGKNSVWLELPTKEDSEHENQSRDIFPQEHDLDIGTTPTVPERDIVPLEHDLDVGKTPLMSERDIVPFPTENTMKEKKSDKARLRKLSNKYVILKKMVKKLREWLKEVEEAWKLKVELETIGTQTKQCSTEVMGIKTEPCSKEDIATQTEQPCFC